MIIWDYLAVFLYLTVIAAIGVRAARRQTTTSEYFVAGRRIPAFAVGFALLATTISSVTFVAIPGSVYVRDCWQLVYMGMTLFVLLFVVKYVVTFYRRVVHMSAYEYLERRFGYAARVYGSAGFVVLRMVDLGFTLYLTSVAVEIIAGWDLLWVTLAVGTFTIIYTLIGGIEGAIWTSVLQGVLFIGGAILIVGVLLFGSPAGPGAILSTAYEGGKFNLGDFSFSLESLYDSQATAWMLMAAGLLHFGRYYTTEQNMVQRYLVARSDDAAKRGVVIGLLTTVPTWCAFMFIGGCLWAFYQTSGASLPEQIASKPDTILPYFISTQLPAGAIGLILAALLSSAMSSVSADLNSVATVATQDYYVRARPQSSEKSRLLFGRLVVAIGGVVSTSVAVVLTSARTIAAYEIVVVSLSVIAGGMLGLFGLGFFTRQATRKGAYVGIVVCLLFTAWGTITSPFGIDLGFNFEMNPVLIGVFSHFILFGVGFAASRLLGGHIPDLEGLTVWGPKEAK